MKKLLIAALVLCAPLATYAGSYTFTDSTTALGTLAHGTAYTWSLTGGTSALDAAVNSGQHVTSATVTFTNIYDWTVESLDVLYVDFLNGVDSGLGSDVYNSALQNGVDTVRGTDPFQNVVGGTGYAASNAAGSTNFKYSSDLQVGTYTDTNGQAGELSTLTITLPASELSTLTSYLESDYLNNTDLGLGLGPDCHFYDGSVSVSITTGSPDGGVTLAMLGAALIGVAAYSRRNNSARAIV